MTLISGRTYNKIKLLSNILDELALRLQELYKTGMIK